MTRVRAILFEFMLIQEKRTKMVQNPSLHRLSIYNG
ncbi:hypothetical protein ZPAH1_orf00411 [Aeromonas phage ZPAH1]|nr:hypothetical protein ZPAH1_orf00411 [Aeromonas phage ZPAH1]